MFADVDDEIRWDVTVEADANRSISLLSVDVGENWDAVKYLNCGPGGIVQGLGLLAQALILSQLVLGRYLEVDGRFNASFLDASVGLQLYSLDIFLHLMYHFFNVRRFDFRIMCSLLTSVQLREPQQFLRKQMVDPVLFRDVRAEVLLDVWQIGQRFIFLKSPVKLLVFSLIQLFEGL